MVISSFPLSLLRTRRRQNDERVSNQSKQFRVSKLTLTSLRAWLVQWGARTLFRLKFRVVKSGVESRLWRACNRRKAGKREGEREREVGGN